MNSSKNILKTNIVLIGAGPIGIEMAVALKASKLEYIQIEAGCLASTINWYAPGTTFFSSPERLAIAGMPLETYPHLKITREEYLLYLRNIISKFALKISYFSKAEKIKLNQMSEFEIDISKSTTGVGGASYVEGSPKDNSKTTQQIVAKNVIFAIGDMHLPKYLGIEGEKSDFVSHYLPDPHSLSFMNIAIIGGKNSAVEAAIRLYRAGAKVTLIHRRNSFDAKKVKPWLLPELNSLIRENKIKLEMETEVVEIEGNTLTLKNLSHEIKKLKFDYTLLLTGYAQDPSLFGQLGIELAGLGKTPKVDPKTCETNIKNSFIIGTAVAGTQLDGAKHFIETSHVHVNRVLNRLGVFDYPAYGEFVRKEEEREN